MASSFKSCAVLMIIWISLILLMKTFYEASENYYHGKHCVDSVFRTFSSAYVLYTIYILLWIMINEHSTYFSFLVNNMRKSQDYFFRRCWKNTGLFFLTTIFYPSVFRVISFQLLYVLFYTKGRIMCNWLYSIGLGQWKCFGTK